jgi:hypothetical protein
VPVNLVQLALSASERLSLVHEALDLRGRAWRADANANSVALTVLSATVWVSSKVRNASSSRAVDRASVSSMERTDASSAFAMRSSAAKSRKRVGVCRTLTSAPHCPMPQYEPVPRASESSTTILGSEEPPVDSRAVRRRAALLQRGTVDRIANKLHAALWVAGAVVTLVYTQLIDVILESSLVDR